MKTVAVCALLLLLAACASEKQTIVPAIVMHNPKPKAEPVMETTKAETSRPANVIGAVEPFYILPMKSAFYARVDTGATTSSIDVENLKQFERDGKKWVSFDVVNSRSKETHHFEKPVLKRVKIKRIEQEEHRVKVLMDIKIGGQKVKTEVTLAERADFEFQGLIGRSLLSGRYIVDTSISYTLK